MGQPVPDDMDGRVLAEMFEPAFVRTAPLQRRPETAAPAATHHPEVELSPQDQAEIEARLRGLGYLE
jgi:hypothetical protein